MGGIFSSMSQIRTRREHKEERSRSFLNVLKNIHTWHLLLVLLPLSFIAATFLRFDHIKMTELRDAVMAADEEGSDEKIDASLIELRKFTSNHIVVNFLEKNGTEELIFGTGPFYLEKQYNRVAAAALSEAEKKAAEMSDDNPNGNVFAKAMGVCQPQAQQKGWAWNSKENIDCYMNVINSFPTSDELDTIITADIPSTALYRHDFASPIWYPSLAGWMVLICMILAVVIICRVLYWVGLQIAVKVIDRKSKNT